MPGLDVDTQVVDAGAVGAPDVAETGVTFAENSLLKARAVAQATGLVAIADDSGLAVDVLGGAPGIFSARWAGRHGDDAANLQLLLDQLADVPDEFRGAAFVCAAALAVPGSGAGRPEEGREVVEYGQLEGTLLREPRGAGRLRLRPGAAAQRAGPQLRRAEPRGEERHQPPGARVPGAAPGDRGGAVRAVAAAAVRGAFGTIPALGPVRGVSVSSPPDVAAAKRKRRKAPHMWGAFLLAC